MGFFRRAGREVEQFKQTAKEAAEDAEEYACQECGARFHTQYDECPECGAETVVETAPEE